MRKSLLLIFAVPALGGGVFMGKRGHEGWRRGTKQAGNKRVCRRCGETVGSEAQYYRSHGADKCPELGGSASPAASSGSAIPVPSGGSASPELSGGSASPALS